MSALISWRNIVDGATVSASSADTGFPETAVQERGLAAFWRSASGKTATLEVDNSAAYQGALDTGWYGTANNTVNAAAWGAYGYSYIGGTFTSNGGMITNNRVARLTPSGEQDNWNIAANSLVSAVAVTSVDYMFFGIPTKRDVIVFGGGFTTVNGVARNRIASASSEGTLLVNYNLNPNGSVNALSFVSGRLLGTESLWIGGSFTTIDGVSIPYFARTQSDGNGLLDTSFNLGVNGAVYAISETPDFGAYIAGDFTSVGGSSRNRIAKVTPGGALDATWAGPGTVSNRINAVGVQPNGKVVVGGLFTTIGGVTRNRLARLNADGSLDLSFNPNLNNTVSTITIQPDGKILVGGTFTTMGGVACNRLIRLNVDGSIDTTFSADPNNSVNAISSVVDGRVVIGGNFTTIDAIGAGRVAVLSTGALQYARLSMLMGLIPGRYSIEMQRFTVSGWISLGTRMLDGKATTALWKLPAGILTGGRYKWIFTAPSATKFTVSRAWIGDALVLPDGVDGGWSMTFRDSGSLDYTDGQQWVESPGVKTRVLNIPIEGARSTEESWGFVDGEEETTLHANLHGLQMEAGTTGEVIAIPRTSTDAWIRSTAVYGHIEQPWSIGHKAGPYWGATLTIVEER